LTEEGDGEPGGEYGVWGADVGDSTEGFGVGEEVEVDRGENAEHKGLFFGVFEVGEVHFCQTVGLDHGGDGENLVGLDCGDQSGDGLADDDEHALDGVGVLGGEGSSDAGISELDLVIGHARTARHSSLSRSFLAQLRNQLHLLTQRNTDIAPQIADLLLKGYLFFFLCLFLLHDLTDVGRAHNGHPNVGVAESSHVVGAIACVDDAAVVVTEIFDDDFLVVGTSAGEDSDELVVVMRQVFGG
jgi:hypothetical protein